MNDLPDSGWQGYGAPGHPYDNESRRKALAVRVLDSLPPGFRMVLRNQRESLMEIRCDVAMRRDMDNTRLALHLEVRPERGVPTQVAEWLADMGMRA